jgi:tetratricopeptide (TPR) repeat protein
VKSFRPLPLLSALLSLAGTLAFSAVVSAAIGLQTPQPSPQVKRERAISSQQPAATEPAPQKNTPPEASAQKSAEATVTRSRRAVEAAAAPQAADNQTTTVPPGEPDQVIGQLDVPASEIVALRDEIHAATSEQARARLQLKLVDYFVRAGLKPQAITALKAMSEQDRFDPQGFYNIANAQARLGETQAAITTYRKAIEQRKGRYSKAANNLGVVLLRIGQWDEAYEVLMSALRQENFRYAEASFNLGRLYAARGENDLAVREWRRAVKVDPEHEAAARALSNTGNFSDIAVTSPVPRSTASGSARRTPADPVRSSLNVEASKPRIGGSKPRRPGTRPVPAYTMDPESYALLQRGRIARERGRNEEAADVYRQVISRTGGYFAPANLELSYVLMSLKQVDEAINTLLPVTARDGKQLPLSHYHLARMYEARGELKPALEQYRLAAEAFGETNNQFMLDIARVQEKQGNLADALTHLERYIVGMEKDGQKPEWSEQRLTALRQKLAASQPKP